VGNRGKTSVDVYAHEAIVVTEALVCARQRQRNSHCAPTRCVRKENGTAPIL
jgi:hypothetical protein